MLLCDQGLCLRRHVSFYLDVRSRGLDLIGF
jgi:hypothetical protein